MLLEDENAAIDLEAADSSVSSEQIWQTIAPWLEPSEHRILDLRYGLTEGNERTQSEVAALFNVTRQAIQYWEKRSRENMKKYLSGEKK